MTTLNTIEIMEISDSFVRTVVGLFLLAIIIFAIGLILMPNFNHEVLSTALMVVSLLLICGCLIGLIFAPEVPTGRFQIEATFTDDFPFTSVMEQYNVIEQRGDIFLLEPKVEID